MQLKRLFRRQVIPEIHAYRGYGSSTKVTVYGRITERTKHTATNNERHSLAHALYVIRSYLARPCTHVQVTVTFGGTTTSVTTDHTGMFVVDLTPKQLTLESDPRWMYARISLPSYKNVSSVDAPILIAGKHHTFGVISDIDDTVVWSNAPKKLYLLYITLFKNATKRMSFQGVTALYRAFVQGNRTSNNPVFYVSSSHWNLFDILVAFFTHNDIPKGPLILKETSTIRSIITTAGQHHHKTDAIEHILSHYPNLPFILIGDSGQKDRAIYTDIVERYPSRIKAVYIRNIARDSTTDAKEEIVAGVPFFTAKNSVEMSIHAATYGFITQRSADSVKKAVPRCVE